MAQQFPPILAAIDVETTGTNPELHEITQLGIILTDHNLEISKTHMPLQMDIRPNNPETHSPEALKTQCQMDPFFDRSKYIMSKDALINRLLKGIPSDRAADLLLSWYESLNLPPKTRLIPLAHNWPFDRSFLIAWLGPQTYEMIFDPRARDTLAIAAYLDDKSRYHDKQGLFSNLKLNTVALKLGYVVEKHHNAFDDCKTVIEIYRAFMHNTYLGVQN